MKALVVSLIVALICAVAFVACERVVVLTPFPGDGGYDSSVIPDAYDEDGGPAHHDGGFPFPDAAAGLD